MLWTTLFDFKKDLILSLMIFCFNLTTISSANPNKCCYTNYSKNKKNKQQSGILNISNQRRPSSIRFKMTEGMIFCFETKLSSRFIFLISKVHYTKGHKKPNKFYKKRLVSEAQWLGFLGLVVVEFSLKNPKERRPLYKQPLLEVTP